jgi:hypothetical protein
LRQTQNAPVGVRKLPCAVPTPRNDDEIEYSRMSFLPSQNVSFCEGTSTWMKGRGRGLFKARKGDEHNPREKMLNWLRPMFARARFRGRLRTLTTQ